MISQPFGPFNMIKMKMISIQRPMAVLLILLCSVGLNAQSVQTFDLKPGPHAVGFKTGVIYDHSRVYDPVADEYGVVNYETNARPIYLSIWYPAKAKSQEGMPYEEYLQLLKREKGRIESQISGFISNGNERGERESKTWAIKNAKEKKGKFPVVIYAPSFNAPSFENSVLCEYLASHGYLVIATPSTGDGNRFMSADYIGANAQAQDIEQIMAHLKSFENVDWNKMAIAGFSWGGISNMLVQMRNPNIDALICLDGSVTYFYNDFKKWPGADLNKVDVPIMYMTQKIFKPKMTIRGDSVNTKAPFDSLAYGPAYYLHFPEMVHQNFGAHFLRLFKRNPETESSQELINQSYEVVNQYALNFLNAYLKDDAQASTFLQNDVSDNGISDNLVEIERKGVLRERTKKIARKLSEANMQKYLGTFDLDDGSKLNVIEENGRIFCKNPGTFEVFYQGDHKFFLKGSAVEVTFTVIDGRAEEVKIKNGGQSTSGKRTGN